MKKILTCLLIVAILGLSACSKAEEVDVTRKEDVKEEKLQENQKEEVTEEVNTDENVSDVAEQKIIPGIYYDKEIYESPDEMESGNFYGFAIRDNNEVLVIMQDFAIGQLEDNIIDIPDWNTKYTIEIEENGIRVKEQGFLYTKCDDVKVIPTEIQNYYDNGELPDYMLEAQITIDYVGEYINPDVTVGFLEDFKDEIKNSAEELIVDDSEYSTELLFMTEKNITDFKFLSIETEIYDDGDAFYHINKEYPVKTFSKNNPLSIKMLFAGDIPSNGFSYKDEDGKEVNYIITISGKDGSIQLFKF